MRFSPDGRHVAYTLGLGEPAATRRLRVIVANAQTGEAVAELPAGLGPRWRGAPASRILNAQSATGHEGSAEFSGWLLHVFPANDRDLDARGQWVAYAADRGDGVRAYDGGGRLVGHWPNTFEPALSDGGTLCLRALETGHLRLERLPGCTDDAASQPHLGAGMRPRWAADALTWEWAGEVYGRVSPNQPTQRLTIRGRSCSHAVPVWHDARAWLLVAMVVDDGQIVLADWADLAAGVARGWPIGRSDGSGFDLDLYALEATT